MSGPHQGQPLETVGAPLDDAEAAVVLAHGRDRNPEDTFQYTADLPRDGIASLAPQAADRSPVPSVESGRPSWYPNAFTAPIESNEPVRSSAMRAVTDAVGDVTVRLSVGSEHAIDDAELAFVRAVLADLTGR